MPKAGDIVKKGIWIYGGMRKCRVEIQCGEMKPGSGDHTGQPGDQPVLRFYVSIAPPLDSDNCPPVWKYGEGHKTLEDAIARAESTLTGCSLKWDD